MGEDDNMFIEDDNESESLIEPVLDEETNKFIELEDFVDKKNSEKMKSLKKGIMIASVNIDNYQANIERFYDAQPFFYDKSKLFWFWNIDQDCWQIVDEVDIMNSIDDRYHFQGLTVSKGIKSNYLEAFKRVGRKKMPKDAPKKWIQFKNKAYSLTRKIQYNVTPEYFFTKPIPYAMGKTSNTPIMDKLFEEWVGKDYVKTLYEIIAYCCYSDYPIQLLFGLYGSGRNGKTCFIRLLYKFLGKENICSTELDTLMSSRFEAFKLYKKLACFMGETNFGTLKQTSILKKLVGGDVISYEKKNKDPFDDINYAKILIASNSYPSSNDTSDGFFRRWLIITFPNEFKEGKDILTSIPEEEYSNLAKKVTEILPDLLNKGKFTNQGTIKERKNKYISVSNPLPLFLEECCIVEEGKYISYNELFTAYIQFLQKNKNRRVKKGEFKNSLEDEGFWVERTSKKTENNEFKSGNWVIGLDFNQNYVKYVKKQLISTRELYAGEVNEKSCFFTQTTQNPPNINFPCHICGKDPSNYWDDTSQGKPICLECYKFKQEQAKLTEKVI